MHLQYKGIENILQSVYFFCSLRKHIENFLSNKSNRYNNSFFFKYINFHYSYALSHHHCTILCASFDFSFKIILSLN